MYFSLVIISNIMGWGLNGRAVLFLWHRCHISSDSHVKIFMLLNIKFAFSGYL
jgi:hypothetical protein